VYDLAKKNDLTPILGLEGYFRDDNCPILLGAGYQRDAKGTFQSYWKYGHITIHTKDYASYKALGMILSDAPMERHGSELKPIFGWKELEEIGSYNVTFGSGCLIGMVQRHLLDHGDIKVAQAYYERLRSIVGPDNFYVEVFPHVCDKKWDNGVYVTLENGEKLRYYDGKRFNVSEVGEISAIDLARLFDTKKWNEQSALLSINNNRKWTPLENPSRILQVEKVEGFIRNECRPWAPDGDVQRGTNIAMISLAKRFGDRILISDDSHYAHPEDYIVQNIKLLAGHGSWRFTPGYHRQSSEEAYEYFKSRFNLPVSRLEEWVENSKQWVEQFKDFSFDAKPSLPTKFYPDNTLRHTMELIKKHGRMQWNNTVYMDRLRTEIDILHKNGEIDLLPYFFLGEEVCDTYAKNGLLTGPGRGSAAGLLLSYLFGITHIDPIEHGLSLERFITLDRIKSGKLPDIDQDLPDRDLLVNEENGWLKKRFGECFAQISVDSKMRLRSSVRDVCRVMHGHVSEAIENLTKQFENAPQGVSDAEFVFGYEGPEGWVDGSIETDEALKTFVNLYPKEWDAVKKCLGVPRHKGRHACGYIIANEPVKTFIPLTKISGVTVTQYTTESVEAVGGVKMDFLSVNSLKDISDCIKLAQEGVGVPSNLIIKGKKVPSIRLVPLKDNMRFPESKDRFADIWDLPEDQDVFNDICEGRTETVFQFNTPSAIQWLEHFNRVKGYDEYDEIHKTIDSVDAMADFTALDRPGPLDAYIETERGKHNMLVEYAKRAAGEKHHGTLPLFDELLPETYGILTYQEQLQNLYQHLTGCTGAEAEEFRRNVAKKKKSKIEAAYPFFMEHATEKIGDEAQGVWDFLQTWASYGFNRSHAVCYASIGYACAYLKHYYPLEWWTAVLRNADKNEINEKFWAYCGDKINMPDVQKSEANFVIKDGRIQAPLSLLHGIGEAAHKEIVEGSPYTSILDFCQRIQETEDKTSTYVIKDGKRKKKAGRSALNRRVVSSLIASGAMDSLFPSEIDGREIHLIDKLEMYERALSEVTGKKPQAIDQKYVGLNPVVLYQIRKSIVPAYSEPLVEKLHEMEWPGVTTISGALEYMDANNGRWLFVDGRLIEKTQRLDPWPPDFEAQLAVAAYVIDERRFFYGDRRQKAACELTLDVNGDRYSWVLWPDKHGKLPKQIQETKLKGAVIIAMVSKYRQDKPFVIRSVDLVQTPL